MVLHAADSIEFGDYMGAANPAVAKLTPAKGGTVQRHCDPELLTDSLQFKCCGYLKNPFVQDTLCTSAFEAAQLGNCVGPFSNFANGFLDLVFTAIFGLAGTCKSLNNILVLC